MGTIAEMLGLITWRTVPLTAVLIGYIIYRTARKTGTSSPIRRGLGTTAVLLLAFPTAFALTAMYVGSTGRYRVLYFVPLVLLGVALYLFTTTERPSSTE